MTASILRVQNQEMLEEAFEVRRTVFVNEQKVPEDLELDAYDHVPETIHLLARDARGQVLGTARFRPYAKAGEGVAKAERVAVLSFARGTGLGRALMNAVETEARKAGFREVFLNAQLHALGFYELLGYRPEGDTFDEAGIAHIAMRKQI